MPHKSEDFKISAVEYYLDSNKTQEEVCYWKSFAFSIIPSV